MIDSLYPIFKRWSKTGSVWIVSDTHFDDADCKLMSPYWITPQEHLAILKKLVHKNDTLIHLGDVGNPKYLDELKCYKVLITGNHDILSKLRNSFDEIYTGPLFIADRILLSHEPIWGLESFCLNIHGHDHGGFQWNYDESHDHITHINMASNVANYMPINLGKIIKDGFLANIPNYHRLTIDYATEHSMKG